MSTLKAVVVVTIAPLIGSLVWLIHFSVRTENLAQTLNDPTLSFARTALNDPAGVFQFIGIGWLYGLVLTLLLGLPIGFIVAFILKKMRIEGPVQFTMAGALVAFLLSMAFPSRSNFWLAITVTGALLGIGYWHVVRKPKVEADIV